jgi:hypothetical protein
VFNQFLMLTQIADAGLAQMVRAVAERAGFVVHNALTYRDALLMLDDLHPVVAVVEEGGGVDRSDLPTILRRGHPTCAVVVWGAFSEPVTGAGHISLSHPHAIAVDGGLGAIALVRTVEKLASARVGDVGIRFGSVRTETLAPPTTHRIAAALVLAHPRPIPILQVADLKAAQRFGMWLRKYSKTTRLRALGGRHYELVLISRPVAQA